MLPTDFDLLDWLDGHLNVKHNLGSSCLPFEKLTDIPGIDLETFNFDMDCGTDMGDPELRSTLAQLYSVEPNQVAITSSASEGNFLIHALRTPGDILVESPTYEPLWRLSGIMNSQMVPLSRPYERKFRISHEELKEKVIGKSLVVLTNIHNPSGTSMSREDLKAVVEICEDAGTTLLVDEIFRNFSDSPSAVDFGENVVINASPSKFFGGCGLRIGHLVGSRELIRGIDRLKILLTPNTPVFSQRAYLCMMKNHTWYLDKGREFMKPLRKKITTWINGRDDVEWAPSEANIAFPRISHPDTGEPARTMDLCTFLADECSVLISPGELFGSPGNVRIGFGVPMERLESGLETISDGLETWWDKF